MAMVCLIIRILSLKWKPVATEDEEVQREAQTSKIAMEMKEVGVVRILGHEKGCSNKGATWKPGHFTGPQDHLLWT